MGHGESGRRRARFEAEPELVAAGLADDPARLKHLRSTLRDRVRASRLCDAAAFVPEFEAALRLAWTDWCRTAT